MSLESKAYTVVICKSCGKLIHLGEKMVRLEDCQKMVSVYEEQVFKLAVEKAELKKRLEKLREIIKEFDAVEHHYLDRINAHTKTRYRLKWLVEYISTVRKIIERLKMMVESSTRSLNDKSC